MSNTNASNSVIIFLIFLFLFVIIGCDLYDYTKPISKDYEIKQNEYNQYYVLYKGDGLMYSYTHHTFFTSDIPDYFSEEIEARKLIIDHSNYIKRLTKLS